MNDAKSYRSLAERLPDAHPAILRFFEAWTSVRQGRLVPRKPDFDPRHIPSLLTNVYLYRFDSDRRDFVCLLSGERINQAWNRSIRGLTLREILGERDHPTVLQRWRSIIETPLVHYGSESERLSRLDTQRAERLILPLESDNGIDHVIGLSLYTVGLADPDRQPLISSDIVRIPCIEL